MLNIVLETLKDKLRPCNKNEWCYPDKDIPTIGSTKLQDAVDPVEHYRRHIYNRTNITPNVIMESDYYKDVVFSYYKTADTLKSETSISPEEVSTSGIVIEHESLGVIWISMMLSGDDLRSVLSAGRSGDVMAESVAKLFGNAMNQLGVDELRDIGLNFNLVSFGDKGNLCYWESTPGIYQVLWLAQAPGSFTKTPGMVRRHTPQRPVEKLLEYDMDNFDVERFIREGVRDTYMFNVLYEDVCFDGEDVRIYNFAGFTKQDPDADLDMYLTVGDDDIATISIIEDSISSTEAYKVTKHLQQLLPINVACDVACYRSYIHDAVMCSINTICDESTDQGKNIVTNAISWVGIARRTYTDVHCLELVFVTESGNYVLRDLDPEEETATVHKVEDPSLDTDDLFLLCGLYQCHIEDPWELWTIFCNPKLYGRRLKKEIK